MNFKKIIILISILIIIFISVLLIITARNNKASMKINSQTNNQNNNRHSVKKISKDNNCEIPKRNNTKCSELSYQECKNNDKCYSKGQSCLTPPQSYIDSLIIIKENCGLSGGEWNNSASMFFLNEFGVCECSKDSKKMFPEDGFCETSISDLTKKKILPDDFYRYYEPLHNRQYKFYAERSENNIVGDVLIDPLIVSFHSDYFNLDEAEYIACLYGGIVVGQIDMISAYQIKFGSKSEEDARALKKEIGKELTVHFVMLDIKLKSDNDEIFIKLPK